MSIIQSIRQFLRLDANTHLAPDTEMIHAIGLGTVECEAYAKEMITGPHWSGGCFQDMQQDSTSPVHGFHHSPDSPFV